MSKILRNIIIVCCISILVCMILFIPKFWNNMVMFESGYTGEITRGDLAKGPFINQEQNLAYYRLLAILRKETTVEEREFLLQKVIEKHNKNIKFSNQEDLNHYLGMKIIENYYYSVDEEDLKKLSKKYHYELIKNDVFQEFQSPLLETN